MYKNETLEEVVNLAKEQGFRVYTFKKNFARDFDRIEQVFIEDKEGRICTVSSKYSGVDYSTVHKPTKEVGTGFGLTPTAKVEGADLDLMLQALRINVPSWGNRWGITAVEKYKNFEEYKSKERILTYYEL